MIISALRFKEAIPNQIMNNKDHISVGIVDFATPTLLLLGSADRLEALADLIEAGRSNSALDKIPVIQGVKIDLAFHLDAPKTHVLTMGQQFDWFISAPDAKAYAEMIREVARSVNPSHTYLDKGLSNELEIIVSKGESDPATVYSLTDQSS